MSDKEKQSDLLSFGMSGPKMFFQIGNQRFTLDYEPEEQLEFEFMKEMLTHALTVFSGRQA